MNDSYTIKALADEDHTHHLTEKKDNSTERANGGFIHI